MGPLDPLADSRPGLRPGRGLLRPRLRRGRWILLAVLAVGLGAAFIASSLLFVWPSAPRPVPAGAILVLNGADDRQRTDLGLTLLSRHLAPTLLFSEGAGGNDCPPHPSLAVVCFVPRPARTVGEIDFARSYAKSHHLSSLLIVSGTAQATRARILARRCFPGRTEVLPAGTHWWEVPEQVVYEWGATAKAVLLKPGCS